MIRRGLVSRTGMKVDFLEAAGSEAIEVSSNDGKQKIVLTQTGSKGIEILSEGPLTVKAMQAVEVTTDTGNLKIKAVNIDIEAQANLNLKAGVNAELSGSAVADGQGRPREDQLGGGGPMPAAAQGRRPDPAPRRDHGPGVRHRADRRAARRGARRHPHLLVPAARPDRTRRRRSRKGSATVLIGGRPAARVGDLSGCGAPILPPGCPTVMIGG